ncbi:MAG TPA: hypothetical protein VH135_03730 [Steroidobacteraceae bacterium]|nr:hypothetical protein [Steroidobacteraceae bacterium]
MEVFLHLWDELDDLSAACRHLAASVASELLEGAAPMVVGASALGVWLLDGLYRELLRFSA